LTNNSIVNLIVKTYSDHTETMIKFNN